MVALASCHIEGGAATWVIGLEGNGRTPESISDFRKYDEQLIHPFNGKESDKVGPYHLYME